MPNRFSAPEQRMGRSPERAPAFPGGEVGALEEGVLQDALHAAQGLTRRGRCLFSWFCRSFFLSFFGGEGGGLCFLFFGWRGGLWIGWFLLGGWGGGGGRVPVILCCNLGPPKARPQKQKSKVDFGHGHGDQVRVKNSSRPPQTNGPRNDGNHGNELAEGVARSFWPWVKLQIVPPVKIRFNPTTKIG